MHLGFAAGDQILPARRNCRRGARTSSQRRKKMSSAASSLPCLPAGAERPKIDPE
jgi:hypothetical protein